MNKLRNVLVYLSCYSVTADDLDDFLEVIIEVLYELKDAQPEESARIASLLTVVLNAMARMSLEYMAMCEKAWQMTTDDSVLGDETVEGIQDIVETSNLVEKLRSLRFSDDEDEDFVN